MSRRLKQVAGVGLVVFAAAQFIRPKSANPPTDAARTIQAQMGTRSELVAVLDRACSDCHSNRTVGPWYAQVAPVSWLMAYGVSEGRKAVNFSEWAGYSTDRQRMLLAASCQDSRTGKMPVSIYVTLHPEARLSPEDVETICAAAQLTQASARQPAQEAATSPPPLR